MFESKGMHGDVGNRFVHGIAFSLLFFIQLESHLLMKVAVNLSRCLK